MAATKLVVCPVGEYVLAHTASASDETKIEVKTTGRVRMAFRDHQPPPDDPDYDELDRMRQIFIGPVGVYSIWLMGLEHRQEVSIVAAGYISLES